MLCLIFLELRLFTGHIALALRLREKMAMLSRTTIFCILMIGIAPDFVLGQETNDKYVSTSKFDEGSRRAQRLSDELKSPFCPGKTLKTCTSPNAAKVRRDIQEMVAKGLSDEEIVKTLKETYDRDDFSVANPEQPGLTIFVPFLPFVILSGAMLWFVRFWRQKPEEDSQSTEGTIESSSEAERREALRQRLLDEDTDV